MPSIIFGPQILMPITGEATGRQVLKRRYSAPELATFAGRSSNVRRYATGEILRLQLPQTTNLCSGVRAEIIRVFSPFTMAAVMVVRIHEPALGLEGDFVLKVYDRRQVTDIRTKRCGNWSLKNDMQLEKHRWYPELNKYAGELMAQDNLYHDLDDEEKYAIAGEEDPAATAIQAFNECWLEAFFLKMYRAELELYRRARWHHLDGQDVPRFISSVTIPCSYTSMACVDTCTPKASTPGNLMQYIPGFPLSDLYKSPSPHPPRSTWQPLIDEAAHMATKIAQHWDARNLDCCPRNTVVHWDPIIQGWKVMFIDFGHCNYRPAGMSDWNWRGLKSCGDEEGEIGISMKSQLKKMKDFDYVYTRSEFWEELDMDFNMELP
ncbi:hypothetical protein T440DRAFT_269989 [Plenodomus tracheiphilus IPT5]|uniref:Uncharacterized protein n=1 Tax=Plenodomus tracheiphilus IPT5 TaxID=1408161 RepID=A0A6A7BFZ9_9PLEO|nr:hypothetical protein T440DRAFT_269989 [Plenodomus tracheiphilus IPT5]